MKHLNYLVCALIMFCNFGANAQVPEVKYSGETPFICGGIGSDESDAIQEAAKKWPLMLQFSEIDDKGWGSWISDVKVRILNNQKQEVLACTCDGPFLLASLKPGEYLVESSYNESALQKNIVIKQDKSEKVSIYWRQTKK